MVASVDEENLVDAYSLQVRLLPEFDRPENRCENAPRAGWRLQAAGSVAVYAPLIFLNLCPGYRNQPISRFLRVGIHYVERVGRWHGQRLTDVGRTERISDLRRRHLGRVLAQERLDGLHRRYDRAA